jgi:hypothetical protein
MALLPPLLPLPLLLVPLLLVQSPRPLSICAAMEVRAMGMPLSKEEAGPMRLAVAKAAAKPPPARLAAGAGVS